VEQKLELNANKTEKEGTSGKFTASVNKDALDASFNTTFPVGNKAKTPLKVNTECIFFTQKSPVGFNFSAQFENNKRKLSLEGIGGIVKNDYQVYGRFLYPFDPAKLTCGLSFFHKLSSTTMWACDFDAEATRTWIRGPIAKVGLEHKFDLSSSFKSRAIIKWHSESTENPEYRLALSARRIFSSHFTGIIGAELNVRQLFGVDNYGDSHSLGLELKLA